MKKVLLFLQAAIISSVAFANNENFDDQKVSGHDFSNSQLVDSSWVGAAAVGTNFSS